MDTVSTFAQFFVVTVIVAFALKFGNQRLRAYYDGRPHLTFRRQLIQVAGALLIVLFLILLLPFGDVLRGQLLSLFGLIVSATIALSSTTLVGNVMAGIMLKTVGNCRPENYITVGDHFGRVSEMDLLHTEIQTEAENAKAVEAAEAEISGLTTRKARIEALIDRKEAKISGA